MRNISVKSCGQFTQRIVCIVTECLHTADRQTDRQTEDDHLAPPPPVTSFASWIKTRILKIQNITGI